VRVLGRFFDPEGFTTLVVCDAAEGEGEIELVVESPAIRNARLLDAVTGGTRPLPVRERRIGPVPVGAVPSAVAFDEIAGRGGPALEPESVEVAATRGLTAEEIIARHQLQRQEQDDALERWTARARIDFHFQLAQSGTLDVSIDSNYFWERGGELEWEQTDYYLNGNRVTWKSIPELPLIQPEKILTLPLDLTLDRTYRYRLLGEERLDDRAAYVLEFQPADPDAALSLYRGRVWIDRSSFARLKAALIQTNLEAPVLSNEEIDRFGPQPAPDGRVCWLFSAIDGQQVWSTAGRTFVVRRELTFLEYEINPAPERFAEQRARAYASSHQMLRDTDDGLRYLHRQPDGTRIVATKENTDQMLLAAGAVKDRSQDHVLPLAGFDYFNYRVAGRNLQFHALFAGVFALLNASKADLFGARADLTADATLSALPYEDRVYVGEEERVEERIEIRPQGLALRLGLPAGAFFKVNLIGGLRYREYGHSDEALARVDELSDGVVVVLPPDHLERSGAVEVAFNRRGFSVAADLAFASRSEWAPSGLYDQASGRFGRFEAGVFVPEEPSREDEFTRWSLTAFKEWYLPRFQKVRATFDLLGGAHLDRYSRHQFGLFGGHSLSGFSGSGVRFDDGAIGRASYAFNLLELIRFSAAVETAWIRPPDAPAGRQSFTGLGLSGNVVAPWKTLVSLTYGLALDADIEDLEGQQEFLLLVFKLW
jgi:hypothetical protein